jgi:antagonist of KipI
MNSANLPYHIFSLGDAAITVDFGNVVDEAINQEVEILFHQLCDDALTGMIEAVPAYSSVSIYYDIYNTSKLLQAGKTVYEFMVEQLTQRLKQPFPEINIASRLVNIPVCYEREFAPDIEELAKEKNISVDEVIRIHTLKQYRVYMLGFLPGFAYMGEVDERIMMPRKSRPVTVAAGSVGIAGKQTGIYPFISPGGWQIIGRTPKKLFEAFPIPIAIGAPMKAAFEDSLSLLHPGDTVQFISISKDDFYKQENLPSPTSLRAERSKGEGVRGVRPNLRIIKAGILDTVQDMGRYGWQHCSINPGGAMDKLSAQFANILVGNKMDEAVIELHFPASAFFFEQPALIVVCGADFSASVNGEPISCWQPLLVSKYSILQFQGVETGARAYLAVHGGLEIPAWLNSLSTHLKAGAGGYQGRALQKDDEIKLGSKIDFTDIIGKKELEILPWKIENYWRDNHDEKILILAGHEWEQLTDESKEKFLSQAFTITNQSDRMGYRLKGELLSTLTHEEVISSAVSFGTVQLLPDGQLIVLMADHQTTGGYPRVAHVISAHHSRLAQMKPGEHIRFQFTDQQTAEDFFNKQQQHLLQLQNACKFKLDELLNK